MFWSTESLNVSANLTEKVHGNFNCKYIVTFTNCCLNDLCFPVVPKDYGDLVDLYVKYKPESEQG